jgi:hypothetical protein
MLGRGVALVLAEAVLRIELVEADHHRVAPHLGENRRSADADAARIAVDDRFEAAVQRQAHERRTAIAIDLHVRRPHAQAEQRAPHRQVGRLQDIERVDFLDVGPRDRPGQGAAADLDRKLLALLGLDDLGVADAADAPPRVEDHRSRDDRSGQRAAPRFVDAGAQAGGGKIETHLRSH